jgi:lysophospholipase L1-like esterase
MNLPDGIHPNASGHKVICDLVYTYLSAPLIAISSKYDQNP